jgi:hypothetical protein
VPADLGERGGDLRQPHTVATQAIWNAECGDAAGNQSRPAVLAVQNRVHDVGYSLLFGGRSEIHRMPPPGVVRYREAVDDPA